MVAVDFARVLSAACLQADGNTFDHPADCNRPNASFNGMLDALPSRGDCGAFGTIPMLTSIDLPGPFRLDMSKDIS